MPNILIVQKTGSVVPWGRTVRCHVRVSQPEAGKKTHRTQSGRMGSADLVCLDEGFKPRLQTEKTGLTPRWIVIFDIRVLNLFDIRLHSPPPPLREINQQEIWKNQSRRR